MLYWLILVVFIIIIITTIYTHVNKGQEKKCKEDFIPSYLPSAF